MAATRCEEAPIQQSRTLERIAQALLEREVIDANEVKLLMEGKPLPEKLPPPPPPTQAAPGTDPKVVRPELRPAPGFTAEKTRQSLNNSCSFS